MGRAGNVPESRNQMRTRENVRRGTLGKAGTGQLWQQYPGVGGVELNHTQLGTSHQQEAAVASESCSVRT